MIDHTDLLARADHLVETNVSTGHFLQWRVGTVLATLTELQFFEDIAWQHARPYLNDGRDGTKSSTRSGKG